MTNVSFSGRVRVAMSANSDKIPVVGSLQVELWGFDNIPQEQSCVIVSPGPACQESEGEQAVCRVHTPWPPKP